MLQIKSLDAISQWFAMHGSTAMGAPLVKQDNFAADVLKFEAGQKTKPHTHPGNHILFVVQGEGWLVFDGQQYRLKRSTCYFVPGSIVHQVGSNSFMLLLSIADHHFPVDSPQRMEVITHA